MDLPLQEHSVSDHIFISVVNTVNSQTPAVYFKKIQLYVKQCQLQHNTCVLFFLSPFMLLEGRKERPAAFLKEMQHAEAA